MRKQDCTAVVAGAEMHGGDGGEQGDRVVAAWFLDFCLIDRKMFV